MPITTKPMPNLTASDIIRFWAQVDRGAVLGLSDLLLEEVLIEYYAGTA